MKIYQKTWRITGVFKVEAQSADEADRKFMALSQRELADDGELEADDAIEEVRDDER